MRRKRIAAISLIELTVSIAVVALAAPPITKLIAETVTANAHISNNTRAMMLANGLMEEVLSKNYEDPQAASGSFGTEEASRALFDDVDDYHGLNVSPPRDSLGNVLADFWQSSPKSSVN